MESLSSLYYSLTFEDNQPPQQWDISFSGFVRRAQLKLISLAWIFLAMSLFTLSLENMALAMLKQGDRGAEVTSLQETLKTKGYFNGPVTGYYGPITTDAVRRFQQVNQLDVDGVAGSDTQGKLYGETAENNQRAPGGQLLKPGQNNAQVRQLQLKLKELGYFNGPTSGYYGTLTKTAVKAFQAANKLTPDGIVGAQTQAVIEGGKVARDNTPFQMDDFTSGNGNNATASPFSDWDSVTENADKIDWGLEKTREAQTATEGITDSFTSSPTGQFPEQRLSNPRPTSSPSPVSRLSQQSDQFTAAARRVARTEAEAVQPDPTPRLTVDLSRYGESLATAARNVTGHMALQTTIYGNIAPKSIVHSGKGLFFAQNMMYTHSITVYDRNYQLVKTISDEVNLQQHGYPQYAGLYRGAPVEASFSPDGQYAWVSNYQMYGSGFKRPGSDKCSPAQKTDPSFLYRINTQNFEIDNVVKVGSVPKYVSTTPDNRYVLVTNWCTDDLSVVDVARNREVRRVKLGRYPRGIVVDQASQKAYVAVMGSQDVAAIDLNNFKVGWFKNVGRSPRHLSIDPQGKYLYTTLNGEGRVAKIDLKTGKTMDKVVTGNAPRSMVLSQDGEHLYVVNYESDTMAKVSTKDMKVVHTVSVNDKPIGVTYDPAKREVWVSCYSGSIMVFSA